MVLRGQRLLTRSRSRLCEGKEESLMMKIKTDLEQMLWPGELITTGFFFPPFPRKCAFRVSVSSQRDADRGFAEHLRLIFSGALGNAPLYPGNHLLWIKVFKRRTEVLMW